MMQADAERLVAELTRSYGGAVDAEEVVPGQLKFFMVSPSFTDVPHLRRQDSVWEVIERVPTREQLLDLTCAPDEIQLVPTP